MQFVIRDDDLCYFTDPKEIENLYGDIWQTFPVTFAAVPFQKGTMAGHMPLKYWHAGDEFPIGDNKALIKFLEPLIQAGNVDIAMHGIHHHYRIHHHKIKAELSDVSNGFYDDLMKAKAYLETLFSKEIKTFVPPSNTMNKHAAECLHKAGFNLLNLPGVRKNSRPLLSYKHQLARLQRVYFHLKHHFDSPVPLCVDGLWEVGGFALTPSIRLETLKRAFLYCQAHHYPFVLATHYWEHQCILPYDAKKTQYDVLKEFLDFVSQHKVNAIGANALEVKP